MQGCHRPCAIAVVKYCGGEVVTVSYCVSASDSVCVTTVV